MNNIKELAQRFESQLKNIKVCAFDVDGILTRGLIHWDGEDIGFNRAFNVNDGYGMLLLMQAGIKVGVVTGGNSLSVLKRFQENLPLDFIHMGNEDKRHAFLKIESEGYDASEILYMGDELFDIPLLKRAGFAATVPHASGEVHSVCDYITQRNAGMGCVREVIDILREVKGIRPSIPDFE